MCLDAVAAVVLDGLSYSLTGTFITTLADLGQWLGEMAASGEAVVVDGLATRVQRPRGWANQKVLYDAKRHAHTAQGLAVSTIHGDLLWVDGGWPGDHAAPEPNGAAWCSASSATQATAERVAAAVETARPSPGYAPWPGQGSGCRGPGI